MSLRIATTLGYLIVGTLVMGFDLRASSLRQTGDSSRDVQVVKLAKYAGIIGKTLGRNVWIQEANAGSSVELRLDFPFDFVPVVRGASCYASHRSGCPPLV